LENANRYDAYDRDSYKIFAGEYAAQSVSTTSPENKNNWQCAIAEAAYLTGLERNAEVVYLTSYAPLFAHVDGWQWTPDLIWFDNLKSYGTPNYYVQKLFSTNKGTKLIPIYSGGQPLIGQNEIYASSVVDENAKEIIMKIVNAGSDAKPVDISIKGAKRISRDAKWILLSSNELEAVNSIDQPMKVSPVESGLTFKGKNVALTLPPYSLSVIKVAEN
jgi:alpha-N-arabinofuranosidase